MRKILLPAICIAVVGTAAMAYVGSHTKSATLPATAVTSPDSMVDVDINEGTVFQELGDLHRQTGVTVFIEPDHPEVAVHRAHPVKGHYRLGDVVAGMFDGTAWTSMVVEGQPAYLQVLYRPGAVKRGSVDRVQDFDLPATTVKNSLILIANQADLYWGISDHEKEIGSDPSCGVRGRMSAREAVGKALCGSGWNATFVENGFGLSKEPLSRTTSP
jgi:hypothetical protein